MAAEYLRRSIARRIHAAYRKAYAGGEGRVADLAGWEEEGVWPDR